MSADTDTTSAAENEIALLLDRFARVADSSSDARELTGWLLSQISALTGWPVAHALLVDPHDAVTMWFSHRSSDTQWEAYVLAANGLAMRTPTGIIDRVIVTRRPGWVSDIGIEAGYPRAAAARAAGLRGVFAVPVVRGGHVVALLQFLSAEPIEPTADFLDGMTIAGYLLGKAFDLLQQRGESVDQPSRLHRIMDAGSRAFVAVDAEGRIASWTRGAERLFGWTTGEAMYRRAEDLLRFRILQPDQSDMDPPHGHRQQLLFRRDGSTFAADISRWSVPGVPIRNYLFFRDVSEQQQRKEVTARDPLTGLVNRAGLLDVLGERLAEGVDTSGHSPVLLMIGLRRFKEIDYSVDHHIADAALCVVGERLVALAERAHQRPQATTEPVADRPTRPPVVARVAGDEFAILFDSTGGTSDIAHLAERVVDTIAEPFQAAGRRLALTAHVGAAEPLRGSDVQSWFGDADAALYRSLHTPGAHRNLHANFEIEGFARRQGGSWRRSLPTEMQLALQRGQFELFYQPIFRLPDRSIAAAEALIRWRHPQYGLLSPGAFIDVAEESGMIAPIGEWVLTTATDQLQAWFESGLHVAVNLSARQLADPGIVNHVTQAVEALPASDSGSGLIVEMTESVLMADPAVAATRIGQFRDMDVRVSIDDFGTGYSSLAYLKWFDVDVIKIDMSFIHGLATSRTDTAIVRTIIDLSQQLGAAVVAEGVETDEQLELLTSFGATHAQGFRLGRPGTAAQLSELIGSATG